MTAPPDVWRICGHPVTTAKNRGCTCTPNDPTPMRVTEALNRFATEHHERCDEQDRR